MLRLANSSDSAAIAAIYNHYALHTAVNFDHQALAPEAMDQRMARVWEAELPWLVVEENQQLLGYACGSPWIAQSRYPYSAESTIYLAPGQVGRGLGRTLYQGLLAALATRRIHSVIGGITLPNAASVALHEKLGFQKVAHLREVGFKFGQWIDVGYWQLLL
ncbi:MAG: GNAT family N-acetyltransferase [Candidatus Competibacterales bacterium]